jgi:hypothetical protein
LLESFKDTSINTSYSHTHDFAVVIVFVIIGPAYSYLRKSEICDRDVDASSTHRVLFPSSAETARARTSTPTPPNLHASIHYAERLQYAPLAGPKRNYRKLSTIEASSMPAERRHRSTVACQNCRRRKVRCSVTVTGIPCSNCIQDRTTCTIQESSHDL